jgi:ribonuclease P protein subunit RPR2
LWDVSLHLSPQKLNESFRRENSEETDITKQIALQRIHTLFRLAKENVHENPELAQRYTEIARKIAMKTNLRLPREYRQLICRHCKSFIPPGVNCRVRIQSRREPHVVVTCLKCGKHTRIPLERKRKNVNAQDEATNKT